MTPEYKIRLLEKIKQQGGEIFHNVLTNYMLASALVELANDGFVTLEQNSTYMKATLTEKRWVGR